jgi:arginine deiminase
MAHCSASDSINFTNIRDSEIIEIEEENFQNAGPDQEGVTVISSIATGQLIGIFIAAIFFCGLKFYGIF